MKRICFLLLAILITLSVLLTGCSSANTFELIEGKHYSNGIGVYNEDTALESETVYDTDIFYRNEKQFTNADPQVVYCQDETDKDYYGKYILFGTTGGAFNTFISDDLVTWTRCSAAYVYQESGWECEAAWAPEVIWDKDANPENYGLEATDESTGVYFMFYTAREKSKYHAYNADMKTSLTIGLAVATRPVGPFKMWNGVEKGATINGVDYGTAEGYKEYSKYSTANLNTYTGVIGRKGDCVSNDDPWFNNAAARASQTFQFNNRDKAGTVVNGTLVCEEAAYMDVNGGTSYFQVLDPHPFVDPATGDKYLYFSRSNYGTPAGTDDYGKIFPGQSNYVVKMLNNDWSQIDYSTITRVTRPHLNFVSEEAANVYNQDAADFDETQYAQGYKETEIYEQWDSDCDIDNEYINEGPEVIYNAESGLYYLTMSVGTYMANTYEVNVAVSYSPMGPFRRLDLDEGGIILSVENGDVSDQIGGTGHHCFVSVGDELIMVYHRLTALGTHNRCPATDRVKWVKNNDGMLVLHVNGPTEGLQPRLYCTGATKYDNIASDAKVSVSGKNHNDVSYLTDDLISVNSEDYCPFIKEFEFSDKSITITFTFDDYRTLRALMMYNSRDYEKAFNEVARIEMDALVNGKKTTLCINNLQFYWDMYSADYSMRAGVSATASFNEVSVKEVRITIERDLTRDEDVTGIPEIVLLGIPE